MTHNSDKMTLEEKIVQKLKSDSIASLIEEDQLTEFAIRAIKEAMSLERKVPAAYGSGTNVVPSPVGKAAEAIAEKVVDAVLEKVTHAVLNDEELMNKIAGMLPTLVAKIVVDKMLSTITTSHNSIVMGLQHNLQQQLVGIDLGHLFMQPNES